MIWTGTIEAKEKSKTGTDKCRREEGEMKLRNKKKAPEEEVLEP